MAGNRAPWGAKRADNRRCSKCGEFKGAGHRCKIPDGKERTPAAVHLPKRPAPSPTFEADLTTRIANLYQAFHAFLAARR